MDKFDRIISRLANIFSILSSVFIVIITIVAFFVLKDDLLNSKSSFSVSSVNLGIITLEKTVAELDDVIESDTISLSSNRLPTEIQIVAAKKKEKILSDVISNRHSWVYLGKLNESENTFDSYFDLKKLPNKNDRIRAKAPIYKRQHYPKKVDGKWVWPEVVGAFQVNDTAQIFEIHKLYESANVSEYWALIAD